MVFDLGFYYVVFNSTIYPTLEYLIRSDTLLLFKLNTKGAVTPARGCAFSIHFYFLQSPLPFKLGLVLADFLFDLHHGFFGGFLV